MIKLTRTSTSEAGTFGDLTADGEHMCYTVERPYDGEHPCIPAGSYTVTPYNSPTKGDVWLLKDVPGRSMIEIHAANWPSQLLGCIAVGRTIELIDGIMGVTASKPTLTMLKATLPDDFELTITEAFTV